MMNRMLSVRIPKKNQPLTAIHIMLLISLFCGFLTDVLSVPSAIKYIIDVLNVMLLVLSLMNLSVRRKRLAKDSQLLLLGISLFLMYTAVAYGFHFQSPLYYLWGIRNNFRFYAFFFGCILFLSNRDVDEYMKLFDYLLYFNSAVCFVQFFVFGLRQDYLGGIFGVEKGCNGYLNIFQVIMLSKTMLFYMHKRETIHSALLKIILMLIVAAMAELKFFFVEAIAIMAGSVILTRMSGRKLLIAVVSVTAVLAGAMVLTELFPYFEGFFSVGSLVQMASVGSYGSSGAVNRLNAIPILSDTILRDPGDRWFGLGLGNCDTSAFSFLNTPFFRRYVYLRYHWFSTAFLFLETGYIGLALFFAFFILLGLKAYKISKENPEHEVYGQIAAISAAMCVLIAVYNSSLRTEAAYMIYFVMAIPFALQREAAEGGDRHIE